MIIKPHLNLTQSLLLCVEKRWRMLAVAALFVVASLLISTWILQPDIWPAFLKGAQSTANFMASGAYQFRRMTSVFTSLGLMGLSPPVAFTLHISVALASIAILLWGWHHQWPRQWLAAGAIFSTLFINPYIYDYDLVALALPIGLLLPDYLQRTTRFEPLFALLLAWLSSANFLLTSLGEAYCLSRGLDERCFDFSLSPWALLLLIGHMAWVLRRPSRLSPVY